MPSKRRVNAAGVRARTPRKVDLTAAQTRRFMRVRRLIRAKYDAAQTTADNTRHWGNADHLSADAATSPTVRATLRSRSRYEVANNSYARGIVETLANDTIGAGPRLQMQLGDRAVNQRIERAFAQWASVVGLSDTPRPAAAVGHPAQAPGLVRMYQTGLGFWRPA